MVYQMLQQVSNSLSNLIVILEKAESFCESKKIDVSVLLNYRLAPDQLPFVKQIQICSDTAKFIAARLSETDAPQFEDKEESIAQLKARIAKTLDYLKGFQEHSFKNFETVKTINPRMPGKYLLGVDYFYKQGIPNFYFHMTTAYSILRHMGVPLGKMDFLGQLPFHDL